MAKKITKSDMLLGPGIYNTSANLNPLYKYKPSSCFASKSFRSQENQKGNQHIINKYKSYAVQLSGEEQIVKPEELNAISPGPGQYYPEKVINSMKLTEKPQKYELQFFGSSSIRFKQPKSAVNQSVGPGYYDLNSSILNNNNMNSNGLQPGQNNFTICQKPKKQVPFSSEQERFESMANWKQNPGPGHYNPKTQIEDHLITRMQVGYKGQFGTSEDRFKDPDNNTPGPGSYISNEKPKPEFEYVPLQRFEGSYFFKEASNAQKHNERTSFIPQSQVPPIGVYDQDFYDISKKLSKHQDIDPTSLPKPDGLGFNSSEQRFKPLEKEKIPEQLTEEPQQSQLQKNKDTKGVGFGNKDTRFKYNSKKNANPGPGSYYDPHSNHWNKRTYNIEFTGIK